MHEQNHYIPHKAKINKIIEDTHDTKSYVIELMDEKVKKEYAHMPGQFNMLTVFGVGEAPISISSSAERDPEGVFTHTIREVGNVTNTLREKKEGDIVGIRGVYGNGWPIEEMKNKNVLLVAGGIGLAPLRPVIYHILDNREDFGNFEIIYGARTPGDLLYPDEYEDWNNAPNTQCLVSVDMVPEGVKWDGNLGVCTKLFENMKSVPENTVVVTCGPEIMMKFAVMGLLDKGFSKEDIYVSMERRMNCGIKKCGCCQIGTKFVCQDGPVFNYQELRNLDVLREVIV